MAVAGPAQLIFKTDCGPELQVRSVPVDETTIADVLKKSTGRASVEFAASTNRLVSAGRSLEMGRPRTSMETMRPGARRLSLRDGGSLDIGRRRFRRPQEPARSFGLMRAIFTSRQSLFSAIAAAEKDDTEALLAEPEHAIAGTATLAEHLLIRSLERDFAKLTVRAGGARARSPQGFEISGRHDAQIRTRAADPESRPRNEEKCNNERATGAGAVRDISGAVRRPARIRPTGAGGGGGGVNLRRGRKARARSQARARRSVRFRRRVPAAFPPPCPRRAAAVPPPPAQTASDACHRRERERERERVCVCCVCMCVVYCVLVYVLARARECACVRARACACAYVCATRVCACA